MVAPARQLVAVVVQDRGELAGVDVQVACRFNIAESVDVVTE